MSEMCNSSLSTIGYSGIPLNYPTKGYRDLFTQLTELKYTTWTLHISLTNPVEKKTTVLLNPVVMFKQILWN